MCSHLLSISELYQIPQDLNTPKQQLLIRLRVVHTVYESTSALRIQHLITVVLLTAHQLQDLHRPQSDLNVVLHKCQRFDQRGRQITESYALVKKLLRAAWQVDVRLGTVGVADEVEDARADFAEHFFVGNAE